MSLANARRLAIVVVGIALAVIVGPYRIVGDYTQFIVAALCFYFIAVLSVNMLAGLCGIWSLGHTAYMAIGAYMAANLTKFGVPVEVIVLASVALSFVIGYILGLSAGRFSVLYFGLLTMALALAGTEVIGHWTAVTGGDDGMKVGRAITLFWPQPIETKNAAMICVLLATLAYLISEAVSNSQLGRRWLAVKGQRIASMAIGLRPHVENATAFGLSSAIASLSGIGMAFSMAYIDPVAFSLDSGVTLIVGTVVGGIGSTLGAVIGSAFITAVPELARDAQAIANFVYGGAMIAVLLFLGEGIVPAVRRRIRHWKGRDRVSANVPRQAVDAEAMKKLVSELMPPAKHTLSLKAASVQFSGLKALDDVSFDIPPGTAVGLIGPNGAGKTSLLNVLSGFYKPLETTSVTLGDANILALAPSGRAALGMGRTFQHAELFPELTLRQTLLTVASLGRPLRRAGNIALNEPAAVAERIIQGLGLGPYADYLPPELPFGVQKVADIGRVLAIGASVVSMDEPFSGLDEHERSELRAILRGMRSAGVSILIIDHAVQEVLDLADKVVVLDFGRMLAAGDPETIRRDPEVMKAYFGSSHHIGEPANG
ncbi:MAG: ATP-binding cassette domain-containing protein [Betaproteobacteria bacterium]|nr:ATP-binding cassette domain-containing protein [Betaproteobacteria bacterium]